MNVSTVIPTYNRAGLVVRAVESALRASAPGDEVIVVDDGSTDGTEERLRAFGGRIRYVLTPNRGAGSARNTGIALARNNLIAFLDSDDEWFEDKLAIQKAIMGAIPEAVFCFSDFLVVEEGGERVSRYLKRWHRDPRPWEQILGPARPFSTISPLPDGRRDFSVHAGDLYEAQMRRFYTATFTLIANRAAAGGALRFPEDLPLYEDYECFSRMAGRGPVAFADCELSINHGHGLPRLTGGAELVKAETRLKVLERVWGSNAPYVERHRKAYDDEVRALRWSRVRALVKLGLMSEARSEARGLDTGGGILRALLPMPGQLVAVLLAAAARLRK